MRIIGEQLNRTYLPISLERMVEREEMGLGSEIFMRVPQTEQYIQPACSTTEGTVRNFR
jgi:hypothetical protein